MVGISGGKEWKGIKERLYKKVDTDAEYLEMLDDDRSVTHFLIAFQTKGCILCGTSKSAQKSPTN